MTTPSEHPSADAVSAAGTKRAGARALGGWIDRAAVNRVVFRGMLITMGSIAVALHRLLPSKAPAWEFAKISARNLARLCGVRVHVHGLDHLRDGGPFIFTPNHQSHFDIAALLGYLPGHNRFVSKKELFADPILGTVLDTLGMIPVDRDNPLEAIQALNEALTVGRSSLIIFPEGTRSRDGALLPFKKGPFIAAIHMQAPIVPIVIFGTTSVMPKGAYLAIVPGDVHIVVEAPIATAGMTYEDRITLRDRVREVVTTRQTAGPPTVA